MNEATNENEQLEKQVVDNLFDQFNAVIDNLSIFKNQVNNIQQ